MHSNLRKTTRTSIVSFRCATKAPLIHQTTTPIFFGYSRTSKNSKMSSRRSCIGGTSSTVCLMDGFGKLCLADCKRIIGELRIMFAQEDIYGGYMDKFFAEYRHPGISWIHDLGRGRHGAASQTLLAESQHASDLQIKHVSVSCFNLGKGIRCRFHICSSCFLSGSSHNWLNCMKLKHRRTKLFWTVRILSFVVTISWVIH